MNRELKQPSGTVIYANDAAREKVPALVGDWTSPERVAAAVEVKRNALRTVYRLENQVQNQGDSFFVKVHRAGSAGARLKRLFIGDPARSELVISRYAYDHGVPAVELLAAARRPDGGSCSVSMGIAPAIALADAFSEIERGDDAGDRRRALAALTAAVAELVACAHDAAFLHPDVHPGNILVRADAGGGYSCFFVDLAGARCGREVTPAEAARNLAALHQGFADRTSRTQRWRFLRAYATARGRWQSPEALRRFARLVERASIRHAQKLYGKRDRRIGGDNAFFTRAKTGRLRGWFSLRLRRGGGGAIDAAACSFGGWPADREGWRAWLADRASRETVWRDEHNVEGFFSSSWCSGLAWRWGSAPAWRRYRTACLLMNRDLPTALPRACVFAMRTGACTMACWQRTTATDGRALASWLANASERERAAVCEAVGRLLADTCRRGVALRSISAGHIEVAALQSSGGGSDGAGSGMGQWSVYWSGVEGVAVSGPCPRHVGRWMLGRLGRSLAQTAAFCAADWRNIVRAYAWRCGPALEPDADSLARRLWPRRDAIE